MPIEIRELSVTANVSAAPAAGTGGNNQNQGQGNDAADQKEELIRECVEKVLEVIHQKMER